ncbi:hypothetical protein O3P69_016708 [Scylla paramamosain]|uniref:Uncharacterized protein n=1 Tax=Scylla paramamosain TaxID=85552 RepID=A0AAW0SZ33_SCYPA
MCSYVPVKTWLLGDISLPLWTPGSSSQHQNKDTSPDIWVANPFPMPSWLQITLEGDICLPGVGKQD